MAGHASSLPGPLGLEAGGHSEKKQCFAELKQWMDGLAILESKLNGKRFDSGNNCLSFTCGLGVNGSGVSTAPDRLCSPTPYQGITSCIMMKLKGYRSESSGVTGKDEKM